MISNNNVVLVDENDKSVGSMGKTAAHKGKGKLHRAISVWIVNSEGKVLITKRSMEKMLWPEYWSNTVCSHPKEGESYEEAGERRLFEEIGIRAKVNYLYKFSYREEYKDAGAEHEMVGVLVGKYDGEVKPHPDEISDYKWVSWEELNNWSKKELDKFTPWFFMEKEEIQKKYKKYFA